MASLNEETEEDVRVLYYFCVTEGGFVTVVFSFYRRVLGSVGLSREKWSRLKTRRVHVGKKVPDERSGDTEFHHKRIPLWGKGVQDGIRKHYSVRIKRHYKKRENYGN